MTLGNATVDFIEGILKIPTGEGQGSPFLLQPFQKRFIREVVDNPHKTRIAILSVGRKAGKTTLIAALVLAHMVGPLRQGRKNLSLYSAALSKDQASLVFNQIRAMVNHSDVLRNLIRVSNNMRRAVHIDKNYAIQYEALSSDVATKFGLIPNMAIFDELGQERKDHNDLYDTIRTGGISDPNFCQYVISTQAPTDAALLSLLIDKNKDNPRAVIHVYGAPQDIPEEEVLTLDTFRKYHIGAGWNIRDEEILDEINLASHSPSNLVNFKNLYLNMRIDTRASAFDPRDWAACALPGKEKIQIPTDAPLYLGLDPSRTGDLTALVAVFDYDNKPCIYPFFWIPGKNLAQRYKDEKIDYEAIASAGWCELSEQRTIDFAAVAFKIADIFAKYNVIQLVYDAYYFDAIQSLLISQHGFMEEDFGTRSDVHAKVRPFTYNYGSATSPLVELQQLVRKHEIYHNRNPILSQHMINAVVLTNKNGDYILQKDKLAPSQRIDGAASLIMAYSAYAAHYDKPSEYGSFDPFIEAYGAMH